MKAPALFTVVAVCSVACLLMVRPARAGLPQPMCVYYGQARDGYGLPYTRNAEVVLYHGNNEIARHVIRGSLTPGVNFALYAHLDGGNSTNLYSARALHSGDIVSIRVRDQDGVKTIMENQAVPPVGQPGELVLINATAGEDLDRDGLPDLWEQELIDWSFGALATLADVHGEDDFDGDGMTNLQEYRAGTFAFLDYDYLSIERYYRTPNNRLRLTFLSVPGKVYRVGCSSNLADLTWQPSPLARSDTDPFQETPVEGTGDWLSLYVPLDASNWFFRVEAR